MNGNPLQPPGPGSEVLAEFFRGFGLDATLPRLQLLEQTAAAFTRIPFENLTKIIRVKESGPTPAARQQPSELLREHLRQGTGGTCFALTATLLHLVRALGWQAEPILADRSYGPDTHSALMIWIDGQPHLLDPGYLIVRPLPILPRDDAGWRIPTSFNELLLIPRDKGRKIELHTIQQDGSKYRLTYRVAPAEPGEFLRAWDRALTQDNLRYPLLTRVIAGRQVYLQKNLLLIRGREGVQRREIDPAQLESFIVQTFGVSAEVASRALSILRRGGEHHGGADTS